MVIAFLNNTVDGTVNIDRVSTLVEFLQQYKNENVLRQSTLIELIAKQRSLK